MKKYLVEIFLIMIIAAGLLACFRYWSTVRDGAWASFEPPAFTPAKIKTGYLVQIKFSNPNALHDKILLGQVTTLKGEESLGEFMVKDIRIWRTDGYRIIKDQIPVKDMPNHITISQKTSNGNTILYNANLTIGQNVLESVDKSVTSKSTITIYKE